jgi:hypothetical protein
MRMHLTAWGFIGALALAAAVLHGGIYQMAVSPTGDGALVFRVNRFTGAMTVCDPRNVRSALTRAAGATLRLDEATSRWLDSLGDATRPGRNPKRARRAEESAITDLSVIQ